MKEDRMRKLLEEYDRMRKAIERAEVEMKFQLCEEHRLKGVSGEEWLRRVREIEEKTRQAQVELVFWFEREKRRIQEGA